MDPNQPVRAAKTIKRSINDIDGQSRRTQRSVRDLTSSLTSMESALAGLGIGLALQQATSIIGGFEEQMASVQAVTQATQSDFESLERQARELGATTRFSATEAASGMAFLGRTGFETNEIMSAMPGLLNLAAAGMLDLGQAADIASNVIAGFGLQATEATRVSDVLAAAAASANTTVGRMGQAFSQVAPVAASAEISIEETAAAIGVLGDAGIPASRAGRNLRGTLAALVDISDEGKDVIRGLGLSLKDIDPTANSLVEVFGRLQDAGLEFNEAVRIFGRENVSAALALTKMSSSLEENREAYENAEGAAKDMAEIMNDTLFGAFRNLRSAIEETILKMGDQGFTGVLRSTIESATELTRKNSDLAASFLTLGAAAGATLVGLAGLGFAITGISTAVGTLVSILTVQLAPSLLAVAAGIGVTIGIYFALKNITIEIGNETVSLVDIFFASMKGIAGSVVAMVATAGDAFGTLTEIIKVPIVSIESLQSAFQSMIRVFQAVREGDLGTAISESFNFNRVLDEIDENLEFLAGQFEGIGKRAGERFQKAFTGELLGFEKVDISTALGSVGDQILNEFRNKAKSITDQQTGQKREISVEGVDAGIESDDQLRDALRAIQDEVDPTGASIRQFTDDQNTLNEAMQEGLLTYSEFTNLTDELNNRLNESLNPMQGINEELDRQIELAKLSNEEHRVQSQLMQIEQELQRQGFELTQQEREQLEQKISTLQDLRNTTSGLTDDEIRRRQIIEDSIPPAERFNQTQRILNDLLREGTINQRQFNEQFQDARINFLETQRDFSSGLERGTLKVERQLSNEAEIAESIVVDSFNKMEDAVANTARNLITDFDNAFDAIKNLGTQLVSDLLADLARLQFRRALTSLGLNIASAGAGAFGGGANPSSAVAGFEPGATSGIPGVTGPPTGFAEGGFTTANRPILVGERGPEIFTPSQSGNVIPNTAIPQLLTNNSSNQDNRRIVNVDNIQVMVQRDQSGKRNKISSRRSENQEAEDFVRMIQKGNEEL